MMKFLFLLQFLTSIDTLHYQTPASWSTLLPLFLPPPQISVSSSPFTTPYHMQPAEFILECLLLHERRQRSLPSRCLASLQETHKHSLILFFFSFSPENISVPIPSAKVHLTVSPSMETVVVLHCIHSLL